MHDDGPVGLFEQLGDLHPHALSMSLLDDLEGLVDLHSLPLPCGSPKSAKACGPVLATRKRRMRPHPRAKDAAFSILKDLALNSGEPPPRRRKGCGDAATVWRACQEALRARVEDEHEASCGPSDGKGAPPAAPSPARSPDSIMSTPAIILEPGAIWKREENAVKVTVSATLCVDDDEPQLETMRELMLHYVTLL